MIDTLVAFGCSNTYGSEVFGIKDNRPESIYYAYSYYLSQRLGLSGYQNYAKPDASNFDIGMSVIDFVLNNKQQHNKIFVIIGWTGDNRFTVVDTCGNEKQIRKPHTRNVIKDLYDNNPSSIVKACTRFLREYCLTYRTRIDHWFFFPLFRDLFAYYVFNTKTIIFLNAAIKYCTIQVLRAFNIPYLSLPTVLYHNHPLYELSSQKNNIVCYDKDENVVFEMNEKYKKYKEPNTAHINRHGHNKFAEELFNYIQEHDLI
jgi:hypothetical protein